MNTKDQCEITKVHEEVVDRVKKSLPNLSEAALLFKALADETRLKIAYALTLEKEMCVCDVAAVINSSAATASHHLRYLRENALASSKRKGRMVYYSLADEHVHQLVTIAYAHTTEDDYNGDS